MISRRGLLGSEQTYGPILETSVPLASNRIVSFCGEKKKKKIFPSSEKKKKTIYQKSCGQTMKKTKCYVVLSLVSHRVLDVFNERMELVCYIYDYKFKSYQGGFTVTLDSQRLGKLVTL